MPSIQSNYFPPDDSEPRGFSPGKVINFTCLRQLVFLRRLRQDALDGDETHLRDLAKQMFRPLFPLNRFPDVTDGLLLSEIEQALVLEYGKWSTAEYPKSYVRQIVINGVRDFLRANKRESARAHEHGVTLRELDRPVSFNDDQDDAIHLELLDSKAGPDLDGIAFRQALAHLKLTDDQRTMAELRLQGLTLRDIERSLGWEPRKVQALARALRPDRKPGRTLKKAMQELNRGPRRPW